jgi:minor extracellular protease Epr
VPDRYSSSVFFWASLIIATLFAPHSALQFPGVEVAFADDHNEGGDDDDDDDSPRPASSSTGSDDDEGPVPTRPGPSGPKATTDETVPVTEEIRLRPVREAVPLLTFRPEIVVLGLTEQDRTVLEGQGYVLTGRTVLQGTLIDVSRLTPPDALSLIEARDAVRALPSGREADLNHFYRGDEDVVAGADEPCLHGNCQAHELVKWPSAAERAATCANLPSIGVLDTGINEAHGLLSRSRIVVLPVEGRRAAPSQRIHGTAVVSVLAGDPGSRVEGVLPEAGLVVADVFETDGTDERTDVETLLKGLDLLGSSGVQVINLSLSGPENSVLTEVVRWLVTDLGVVVVASVGNGGRRADVAYPAGIPEVVAVTAVDPRLRSYDRAQRGEHVDLAAPGVGLLLATSISGAREKSGTSFAAPFVTAAAALVLAEKPDLAPAGVATRLMELSTDLGEAGMDPIFGAGLLNTAELCR